MSDNGDDVDYEEKIKEYYQDNPPLKEKADLKLPELENGKYIYCSYTFTYLKEVEIIYENNPCTYQKLIIGKYYIDGPECLTLGHEELSPIPSIAILETPKIANMDKLNVKIGTNNPTSYSISAEYSQYTSTFVFDVIKESPNYDYMVQLPIDGKRPIYLESITSKIYRYMDMINVEGSLAHVKEAKLVVTLRDAITEDELPQHFYLDSTTNKNFLIFQKINFLLMK